MQKNAPIQANFVIAGKHTVIKMFGCQIKLIVVLNFPEQLIELHSE